MILLKRAMALTVSWIAARSVNYQEILVSEETGYSMMHEDIDQKTSYCL
jgi:hypothetical protein